MKKIGAFVGKFLPPHIGHISIVDKMLAECDEAVVVVSDNPEKSKELCQKDNFPYFDSKKRLNWFKQYYKGNKKLHFAIIDESLISKDKNFMEEYAKLFSQCVPYKVNVKYADESYRELNERYFVDCTFVAIDRDVIKIHGTDIRKDFEKNKQFVLKQARKDIEGGY
jgi:HTH-type transcriptional regulator, transcriptional repressor of NAD biosynthesis genes